MDQGQKVAGERAAAVAFLRSTRRSITATVLKWRRTQLCAVVLSVTAALPAVSFGAEKTAANAVVRLSPQCEIHFLVGASAQEAIVEDRHDPFFRLLSRLDGEIRLRRPLEGSRREEWIAALKDRYRNAVRSWTVVEMEAVTAACRHIHARALVVGPGFVPKVWKFVKTDGSEESGAAYTRHDAIVLPEAMLNRVATVNSGGNVNRLVAHETSHVLSRTSPELQKRLYGRLGFRHVGAIDLGTSLAERRLTNPDGPSFEHVIRVATAEAGEFDAVLVTYSKSNRFSPDVGENIFAYLRFGLFAAEATPSGWRVRLADNGEPTSPLLPNRVSGFFEKTGRNTNYIIHPDEILADNLSIVFGGTESDLSARPAADQAVLRDLCAIVANVSKAGE